MTAISPSFFSVGDDQALRLKYDHRSCLRKIVDLIYSIFRQIQYTLTYWFYRIFYSDAQFGGQKIRWNRESQGLALFLHGLHSSPHAWYSQLSYLKDHRNIDVYAPIVPKRGICSLEEACTPIIPQVIDYTKNHPGKPVCLFGVSNGSRMSTRIETQLRKDAPNTPIRVSTIAGVHFGSNRMNLFDQLGLASWIYPQELREELKYGSFKAKELLDKVLNPLPDGCAPRTYEFFATTEDLLVPNLESSIPQINKNCRFRVLHGESHDSIVPAIAKEQIENAIHWMKQLQKN